MLRWPAFLTAGIVLAKTTAARNEVALNYHRVHGLYFLAVISAVTIITPIYDTAVSNGSR